MKFLSSSNIVKRGVHCSIIDGTNNSRQNIETDSYSSTTNHKWHYSANHDHHKFSPLYAGNSKNIELYNKERNISKKQNNKMENNTKEEEVVIFKNIVIEKVRSLPSKNNYFVSNHVLINKERMKRIMLPLYRDNELDDIASERARFMASQHQCVHSDLNDLISKTSCTVPFRMIGENVCSGDSINTIHEKIIYSPKYIADKNNMLDRRYSSFGVGVAMSTKGKMYVCQIFKG